MRAKVNSFSHHFFILFYYSSAFVLSIVTYIFYLRCFFGMNLEFSDDLNLFLFEKFYLHFSSFSNCSSFVNECLLDSYEVILLDLDDSQLFIYSNLVLAFHFVVIVLEINLFRTAYEFIKIKYQVCFN
ncbi:hypothetical protein ABFS83_08G161300 [Erythranthe nasuta]